VTAIIASIPSPSQGVWNLGPIPIRAYALCIIAGIVVAVWWGNRRYEERGGQKGLITDIAIWAVPFGIVGGRLYHVITDHQLYFGPGGAGLGAALRIWDGGLGIWGAVALGGVGAWIGCRRRGIPLPMFGDAIAPGIALAQAIGRWGNWFNQELFGKPTTLPWALEIAPAHRPVGYTAYATFHPTFLYESTYCLLGAVALLWIDRRSRLRRGQLTALYVASYTFGRFFFENLRIDDAHHLLGMRINAWVSLVAFLGGVTWFFWLRTHGADRDTPLIRDLDPVLPVRPRGLEPRDSK